MNKSLVALAVAGGLALPVTAMADAGAWGRINLGIQNVNDEGVDTYGQDEGLGMKNVSSRFGFSGDEDLGNGLTALYHYEFGVDATNANIEGNGRQSYIGLSGDFGQVTLGQQWSAWYDYLGWNTDRSQFWGGTGYYGYGSDPDGVIGDAGVTVFNVGPTTRGSDIVKYTYGAGGYGSDPFTFTVEAQMDGTSAGGNADGADLDDGGEADPQAFDLLTLAGQATFGDISVNFAHRMTSSNDTDVDAEPSQTGFGVRWSTGPFYVGGSYITTDRDTESGDNDSPSVFDVLATYDLGNGLNLQGSVSQYDNDTDDGYGDTTGVFLQVNQEMSSRTNAYAELQSLSIDGGDQIDDISPQVLLVGIGHSF